MTAPVPDHAALPVEQLRISPPAPIDTVEFWTCDDAAERLSTTELEEAVIEHVDGWSGPGPGDPGLEGLLRETIAPLKVYGWSRAEVTDAILDHQAESMVEHLTEQLNEDEWGDPDGNHDVLSEEGQALLTEKIAALLRKHRGYISPWACEVTKTVVLEADDLVAMVRQQCPEWFEPKNPLPPVACSKCGVKIRKFVEGSGVWHACLKCNGELCEKCCDLAIAEKAGT